MALKNKIDKATFAALNDVLKAEYVEDGEGYKLDTDAEDVGELRRANARLKEEAKAAKKAADDAKALLDDGEVTKARNAGDVAALENSYKEKMAMETGLRDAQIAKLKAHTQAQLVDNVAAQIAGKLTDSPALLIPHIKARLAADFEGDSPQTRVLDATGKISAFTTDDLTKEFAANKDFSAIIRVSKASGGGAAKATSQYQAGGLSQDQQNQDLSRIAPADLAARITAKKEAQQT